MSRPSPDGRLALINGRVIAPEAILDGKAVIVERGRILDVADAGALGGDIATLDVSGRYIAPGLIDIHTHGAMGHAFNEPTMEAWAAIAATNAACGVTSLLATLATAPIEELLACLRLGRAWLGAPRGAAQVLGAQVLGVHLEGPYFSFAQRGAQNPAHLRTPDDGTADALLDYADVMRVMSFAPELPGALDLAARLARFGVVAAAGHSSAKDSDVLAAMRVGLRHTIHIWSGQSTTIREGPWRRPGLLEATLALDGLTAEMISDNRHLPPTLMRLAYKCLGADRLCAISDATCGAGFPEGTKFTLAGMECDIHDGVAMLLDRTSFAGSSTLLNRMVPILTEAVGIPLPEAVRMASLTPARVIGADRHKGSLQAGKDADIAVFEEDFTAWRTMIGGRWAYSREPAWRA